MSLTKEDPVYFVPGLYKSLIQVCLLEVKNIRVSYEKTACCIAVIIVLNLE